MAKRPRIKIVSDTVQEFLGVRYYLCDRYFQHKGRRLHRVVWEAYRGEIPKGYHVHHHDGNTSNNRVGNLRLVTPQEHRRIHGPTPGSGFTDEIRAKVARWHSSDEGREWHRKQWAEKCGPALAKKHRRRCEQCVGSYWTTTRGGKFCYDRDWETRTRS